MRKSKQAKSFIDLAFTHLINNPSEAEYMYVMGTLNLAKFLGAITDGQYREYAVNAQDLLRGTKA